MGSVSDAQLRQLKKFMDDSSLTCTVEWLEACVSWVRENFEEATLEVLKRELRVQWKDTSLEDMESSCLPPNLVGQRLAKLTGKYGLQVNSVRDIGESSYSQWTKLKKLENENTSVAATDSNEYKQTWQPTPKRCLYLNMTDGKQKVFGMEMQPIPGLSINLKPGMKIIILGPVECRRGVFHLRPNNVRIEGGEVEELLESNTTEKILTDILKVPPDNRSRTQASSTVTRNVISQPSTASRTNTDDIIGDFPESDDIIGDFPESDDNFPDAEAFEGDDDIFMEIDEEALINSATSAPSTSTSSLTSSTSASHSTTTTSQVSHRSRSTNFTEEIEDFEDDPQFTNSTSTNSSSTSSSRQTGSSSGAAIAKQKSTFVPPLKPAATTTSKNRSGSSSMFPSKKGNPTKLGTSSHSTSGNDSALPGFSSAKTALTTTSKGSSGTGKQLKILTYMKPMPVIIDPPTPERRLKRRRKSVDEGVSKAEQEQLPSMQVKIEENCEDMFVQSEVESTSEYQTEPNENFENDEDELLDICPDDSLMRIVDEEVERRLSEDFERDPAEPLEIYSSSTSSATPNARLSYPVKVSEHPYVLIQQIQESASELARNRKVVNVKACISTVVSNIKVDNGCWTLGVCINDGTGYINCKICPNLLNSIIGFSPTEMKTIKATKTKEGKQRIAEAMSKLATRLLHLNAILSIEIGEPSVIIDITDPMLHHSTALNEVLSQLGL